MTVAPERFPAVADPDAVPQPDVASGAPVAWDHPVTALRRVLAVAAGVAIAAYVVVALIRLRSPVELEWIEGGMVDQVRRVLDGEQLYHEPHLESVPYLYTPLFTWLGAAVSWFVGVGPEPLRAISLVSSLVAFWATARLVVAETADRWAGLVGAGILAASFVVCGAWFDVARVDSLMLALTLVGALRIRTASTDRDAVVGGLLLVLAVLAKQDAALPAVAVLVWLAVRDRRRGAVAGATFVGLLVAVSVALQVSSDGWFWFYVVEVPRSHELVPASMLGFFTDDLRPYTWLLAAGLIGMVAAHRRGGGAAAAGTGAAGTGDGVDLRYVAAFVASMVLCGWAGRIHSGGWDNVLMPAVAAMAVLGGLAAATARRVPSRSVAVACLALLLAQFWALRWSPQDHVPADRDERTAVAEVAALADLPQPVYLPAHPWLLALSGSEPTAQSAALADVLRGPRPEGRRLSAELDRAFREQRFAAVVVDSQRWMSYLPDSFEEHYRFERDLLPGGRVSESLTGFRTGPAEVWVPRD